jgi:hypothetical protein
MVERFEVLNFETISTSRLDDLIDFKIDFIKLDIQGWELNALNGAQNQLRRASGIEIEVEFLQMYLYQPLFGDVVSSLKEIGFDFIDFVDIVRWERKEYSPIKHFGRFGQAVFADALFLKSPETFISQTPSRGEIFSYLVTLLLYGRFDLMRTVSELVDIDTRCDIEPFMIEVKRLSVRQEKIKSLNKLYNNLLKRAGFSGSSHLLY